MIQFSHCLACDSPYICWIVVLPNEIDPEMPGAFADQLAGILDPIERLPIYNNGLAVCC
jgi:hypothetical protein